jgi:acetoin:2,6-dichlorophenolindophenol oxidoreductase subunit beta
MITYLKSLQLALHSIFEKDSRVVLLGEDILDPYGGAFKVSMGLSSKYKERVITTPISESSIIGVANGLALRGLKPIAEIMFGDFLTLCADQIINHAAKFRRMYNDQVDVPIVIRTPMGGGRGYGPTHSQSIEKLFLGVPHLRVIAPSHLHDPGQILTHCIENENQPVLFIEHKLLYPAKLLIENVKLENEIPGFPTAVYRNFDSDKSTPDITIIGYGGVSRLIIPLMEELRSEEIRISSVFPSSIKPLPLKSILNACELGGNIIIVEEGTAGFNWGSEVSSLIYEHLWQKLKAPIVRLSSKSDIIPTSSSMEDKMLISTNDIREAIFRIL